MSTNSKGNELNAFRLVCTLLVVVIIAPTVQSQVIEQEPPVSITRSTFAPVPLKVSERSQNREIMATPSFAASSGTPLLTVASSLAIVLGLFAAVVWVSRKSTKNSIANRELPDDALRILGKKSLGTSGSIALVRCGPTVLIVSVHSSGMQRLGEITGLDEVRRMEALCTGESKASFDATLAEIQREPIKRGFIGEEVEQATPRDRHKLFS